MRKLIFLLLLIGIIIQVKATKIALIGDSPEANKLCDLVLVKLSKESGIELFERQQIEAVLKERKLQTLALTGRELPKLSKLLHTDIFAIVSSGNKKAKPISLRVFNAKNGFIILDTALPSNIRRQAAFVSKNLKKSLQSMQKKQLKLAVLAIRNAGVGTSLFYRCVRLAADVNRFLAASPDIAILERTNLDMVNRERKIIEKHYNLSTATTLIDFEFLPMDTPEKIKMCTRVLNRQGKVLKTFSYKNITQNSSLQKNAAADILAFLKVKPGKVNTPSEQEAKRFYQEFTYTRRINFDAAYRKISAAIALDPKPLKYRRKLAYLLMDEAEKHIYPKKENAEYFKMLRYGLQILSEIRKESPNYRSKNLFSAEAGVFNSFSNRYSGKKIPEELIECAKTFRRHTLNEILKYYPTKLDKKEAFKSFTEMKNYCSILVRTHNTSEVLSKQLAIDAYFTDLDNYLDRSMAFFINHPALLETTTPQKQIRLGPMVMPVIFTGTTYSKLFFKAANQQRKIIAKMKHHLLPIIKTQGALLELYANLYRDNFSVESFRRDVIGYFKYIKALFPPPDASKRTIHAWSSWEGLGAYLSYQRKIPTSPELRIVLSKQSYPFMLNRNSYNIDKLFAHILRAKKNKNQFIRALMVLKKIKKMKHISSYDPSHTRLRLEMYMKQIKAILIRYNQEKLYDSLEVAVGIKQAKPVPMLTERLLAHSGNFWRQYNSNSRIIAAESFANKVYFCFIAMKRIKGPKIFEYSFALGGLNIKTKRSWKISSYNGFLKNSRFGSFYKSLIYRGKFYLACKEGILVFPLNKRKAYMIDKLPAEYVYTIAGLNGRIYIALEGKNDTDGNAPPPKLLLMSCKPDGSDRKIISSSLDRKKRNIFDRDKAFRIEYIWGDEKRNRLLILACKPLGGLWEFYPATDKAKNLCNLGPLSMGWGKYMNGKLYFSMRDSVYFEFDPKNNLTRFLYCNKGQNSYYMNIARKYSKLKVETVQKHSAWFKKFYRTENWLWYGHDCSMWRLDLKNPKHPKGIDGIRGTNSEFPILAVPGKNAIIVVTGREIFYVGEK